MSNGEPAEKHVDLGPDHAGAVWRDFLGHRQEEITLDESGKGAFPTNGGSVSVWVPAESG
jgi:alpha-amylase